MRILVVNRERSHASLIGSALKRLGHKAVLSGPADALARLADEPYDGVIAESHPTAMELADRLHAADVPFALSGDLDGSIPGDIVTTHLPRVWTVVDLRRVVDDFSRDRQRFARGSSPSVEFDLQDDGGTASDPETFDLPALPTRRAPVQVVVSCRTWSELERLCSEVDSGRNRAMVRGKRELFREQHVQILLRLPDELTLTVDGRIASSRREPDGRFASSIDLADLDAPRLRDLIPRT
jgi:plasmid stabilization system protein ParE